MNGISRDPTVMRLQEKKKKKKATTTIPPKIKTKTTTLEGVISRVP